MLRTLLIQTVLKTADFVKAAATAFLYIVLINNQMYVFRDRKTHLGYTEFLLFP